MISTSALSWAHGHPTDSGNIWSLSPEDRAGEGQKPDHPIVLEQSGENLPTAAYLTLFYKDVDHGPLRLSPGALSSIRFVEDTGLTALTVSERQTWNQNRRLEVPNPGYISDPRSLYLVLKVGTISLG